ncbi:MAG: hypothetical protein ACPG47_05420 [Leucothrix sp.]
MPKKNNNIANANRHSPARQLYDESKTKVSDESDNLEAIREILFGEQSREAEKRRHDTHHTLQQNIAALKQDTQNQFEFLSAEINKLFKLLSDENANRQHDKQENHQLIDGVKASLEHAKAKHVADHDTLQQKLTEESSKLEQQATKRYEDLSQKLEQASLELKSDKTDRGDLAKLLQGMAQQLLETTDKR